MFALCHSHVPCVTALANHSIPCHRTAPLFLRAAVSSEVRAECPAVLQALQGNGMHFLQTFACVRRAASPTLTRGCQQCCSKHRGFPPPSTPWCSPCLSGQIGCQHVSQTEGLNEAITGPGNINVSTCTESTDKRTGRTTCASRNLPACFLMAPRAASLSLAR